jgi:glycosyltransferase involved in cell wall biosynthesis
MIVLHANHLVSIGHEVSIMTTVLNTVFSLDSRITIEMLPVNSKFGTILTAIRTKFSADLVLADIVAMVCFLAVRNRNKLICFAQDYDESYYSSKFQKWLIRFLYIIGLMFFRIPVIAVSIPLAHLLKSRFGATVEVAENGVDVATFFPELCPQLIGEKGQRKAVLILSRSDQRKGFDVACAVMQRLAATHAADVEVWTVGEPNEGLFPGMIHRHLGYVGEARLRTILSSADLFLYPSRHEGFPLMPMEGFACRCPVVTTSAVPYAVHGENALVSPIEDIDSLTANLITLLDDEHLRNNLVQHAGKYAASCTLAESKRKFHAALLELVQR